MRIADAQWIPATVHQTWDALHDPEVLQRCIPGCVQVERRSPSEYGFTVRSRVGGLEADYEGEVLLSDVDAPRACTLAFEGKGLAAGLVIGTAQLHLSERDNGTRVAYTVAGQVGGKLGEVGVRGNQDESRRAPARSDPDGEPGLAKRAVGSRAGP